MNPYFPVAFPPARKQRNKMGKWMQHLVFCALYTNTPCKRMTQTVFLRTEIDLCCQISFKSPQKKNAKVQFVMASHGLLSEAVFKQICRSFRNLKFDGGFWSRGGVNHGTSEAEAFSFFAVNCDRTQAWPTTINTKSSERNERRNLRSRAQQHSTPRAVVRAICSFISSR